MLIENVSNNSPTMRQAPNMMQALLNKDTVTSGVLTSTAGDATIHDMPDGSLRDVFATKVSLK